MARDGLGKHDSAQEHDQNQHPNVNAMELRTSIISLNDSANLTKSLDSEHGGQGGGRDDSRGSVQSGPAIANSPMSNENEIGRPALIKGAARTINRARGGRRQGGEQAVGLAVGDEAG